MKIITVANLKGGAGKTTSAAFLAHAYEAQGKSVLLVDTDPQKILSGWGESAGWNIPVVSIASENVGERLQGMANSPDVVIIDTPPGYGKDARIVASAVRVSHQLVIVTAPTISEVKRVPKTMQHLKEAIDQAGDLDVRILLNRVVHNSASRAVFRAALEGMGASVLRAEIPRREAIAQAEDGSITKLYGYDTAVQEMEESK